jgi:triphosphoribosyl-dephospho-CoA synthetase
VRAETGLVTPFDTGSHDDMDAATFMRSLFSLRGYFAAIAHAGARQASLGELQQLGISAEGAMSRATGGINTHRGAIFSLGLLVAGGRITARATPIDGGRGRLRRGRFALGRNDSRCAGRLHEPWPARRAATWGPGCAR